MIDTSIFYNIEEYDEKNSTYMEKEIVFVLNGVQKF